MGHLNDILVRVGGNLNSNFQKTQMPGGLPGGGELKLRFDRYITCMYVIMPSSGNEPDKTSCWVVR